MEDPLRRGDVVGIEQDGRVAVRRVRELMEREVGLLEGVIRPTSRRRARQRAVRGSHIERRGDGSTLLVAQARAELILDPVVRTGLEVAAGARLAVAARLFVPEQRLAECDGARFISYA